MKYIEITRQLITDIIPENQNMICYYGLLHLVNQKQNSVQSCNKPLWEFIHSPKFLGTSKQGRRIYF